ncbi:MAG: DNA primase [Planctomycetota bacterium]|jgi:DNA primase|nr:DNA primase [Planctomycetota bacterium]
MAIFGNEFKERVKAANDIVQVAESYNINLKRSGSGMMGLCPFHDEKTPSFSINPADQFFYCHGCHVGGDVITLVEKLEKVEFPEAVRILAERAGIPVEVAGPAMAGEARNAARDKEALLWCCSRALDYFEAHLAGHEGKAAREYLRARGFSEETIRLWRLGWAPDSWAGLRDFLQKDAKEAGQKAKIMLAAMRAGVLKGSEEEWKKGSRNCHDVFRGRVMFPIMDSQSRPIAFGGRLLKESPGAGGKYVNTKETRIFEKKKVLFGLNRAAREIGFAGEAVLVEGYVDVIMCHQYGVRNVVGTLGTSLTEEHAVMLRRQLSGKGRAVAFFDSDAAGESATRRAIEIFMAKDVPLAVAPRLETKDAGEFLPRYGVDGFRDNIRAAEDSFSHLLARTIGRAEGVGNDSDAMARAVREIMDVIGLCPDPVKSALMRRRVAAEAGVPEEVLTKPSIGMRSPTGRSGRDRETLPAWKPGLAPPGSIPGMEDAVLQRQRMQRRLEMRLFRYLWESREWGEVLLDRYPPEEWQIPVLAELAALVRDLRQEGRELSLSSLQAKAADPGAAECLARLAIPTPLDPGLSEQDFRQVLRTALHGGISVDIREVREELVRAQRKGDALREDELLREYTRLLAVANAT